MTKLQMAVMHIDEWFKWASNRVRCLLAGHRWIYHCEIWHHYRRPYDPVPMPTQITGIKQVWLHRTCAKCLQHDRLDCTWKTH